MFWSTFVFVFWTACHLRLCVAVSLILVSQSRPFPCRRSSRRYAILQTLSPSLQIGWLGRVDLMILRHFNYLSVILRLGVGDPISEIQVARAGFEPRAPCSASPDLDNSTTAAALLLQSCRSCPGNLLWERVFNITLAPSNSLSLSLSWSRVKWRELDRASVIVYQHLFVKRSDQQNDTIEMANQVLVVSRMLLLTS